MATSGLTLACTRLSAPGCRENEAQRPLAICARRLLTMKERRRKAERSGSGADGRTTFKLSATAEDVFEEVWSEEGDDEAAKTPASPVLHNGIVDYYELLGVDDDASHQEIKVAYRSLAKECHPDYLGIEGHNICILLNEAYEVLSSSEGRKQYNEQLQVALIDEMDDFTGKAMSKWLVNTKMGKNWDPNEERAVFVDECSCIGCKQCVWIAPAVYRLESAYGRSRVFAQWANDEDDIQASIDCCPVDCISWVHKDQLPALEYVTQNRTKRNNVANIMSGMGSNVDVFAAASQFMKARERKEKERAKSTRRSEQQERARKQAAANLMKKRGGWMTAFGSYMESAFSGVARSVDASMDEDIGAPKVGSRKRHAAADPPSPPGEDQERATVPVERSLVRLKK